MALDYTLKISGQPIGQDSVLKIFKDECLYNNVLPLENGFSIDEAYDTCGFIFYIRNEIPFSTWDVVDMRQRSDVVSLNGEFVFTQYISFGMNKFFDFSVSIPKMLTIVIKTLELTTSDVVFILNDSTRFYRHQEVYYLNGYKVFGDYIDYGDYFNKYTVI